MLDHNFELAARLMVPPDRIIDRCCVVIVYNVLATLRNLEALSLVQQILDGLRIGAQTLGELLTFTSGLLTSVIEVFLLSFRHDKFSNSKQYER